MKRLLLLLLWLFSLPIFAQVKLENIQMQKQFDRVQIFLQLSSPTKVNSFYLDSPARIVVDLHNTQTTHPGININHNVVNLVRTGQREANITRVVVDLKQRNNYKITGIDERGKHWVIIDIPNAHQISNQNEALPPANNNQENIIPKNRAFEALSIAGPSTKNINPGVKRSASNNLVGNSGVISNSRPIIIVIDPGHGGKDPGAINRELGLREKDIALAISKRLHRILNQKPGLKAELTRNKDVFISLPRRVKIARAKKADLFISIHADSVESKAPRGSSIYMLSNRGASSQLARYLANSENEADLKWGVEVDKYDEDLQSLLLNIQQEGTLESSALFAEQILKSLTNIGKMHKKKVERASFAVLRAPDIPSILVETAFLSNNEDAKLLSNPDYQERLAQSIAEGIENFLREHRPQHLLIQ